MWECQQREAVALWLNSPGAPSSEDANRKRVTDPHRESAIGSVERGHEATGRKHPTLASARVAPTGPLEKSLRA